MVSDTKSFEQQLILIMHWPTRVFIMARIQFVACIAHAFIIVPVNPCAFKFTTGNGLGFDRILWPHATYSSNLASCAGLAGWQMVIRISGLGASAKVAIICRHSVTEKPRGGHPLR